MPDAGGVPVGLSCLGATATVRPCLADEVLTGQSEGSTRAAATATAPGGSTSTSETRAFGWTQAGRAADASSWHLGLREAPEVPHDVQPPRVRVADDLVDRDFNPPAPDRLWASDIKYVSTWEGTLYLASVIDCFSRKVVGWSMRADMQAELVVDALEMAIERRQPAGELVHHSDQGSQYVALIFGQKLRKAGIAQSMGSKGDCYDNAVCESFHATLKKELLRSRSFKTRQDAKTAIFDWIEAWYNPARRHSGSATSHPTSTNAARLGVDKTFRYQLQPNESRLIT